MESYSKSNSMLKDISCLSRNVLDEILNKQIFQSDWQKKFNYNYTLRDFSFNYKILKENSSLIKVQLSIKKYFSLRESLNDIVSGCQYDYIVILETARSKLKIIYLILKEENPQLYYSIKNDKLNYSKISAYDNSFWLNKISSLDSLYNNFFNNKTRNIQTSSYFDIQKACNYAESFALDPNPQYKSYDNIGGDCTNFISQILSYGGIKENSFWKPYTHSWIRVQELYSYLINNKIAYNMKSADNLYKGCIIQFYTPQKGYFFHSGFITHELEDDYLYCCHSYNKLNYPLSAIYPIIYPTIRSLTLYQG